jgi:hypothetical protein
MILLDGCDLIENCVAESLPIYSALTMDERAPFKDITNIPAHGASGSTSTAHDSNKKKANTGKRGWYARMSDEKKAEYLNKLRISRQQKKAAAALTINANVNEPPSSLMESVCPTPFIDVMGLLINANSGDMFSLFLLTYTLTPLMSKTNVAIFSMQGDTHNTAIVQPNDLHEPLQQNCNNKVKNSQSWYAQLSGEKKAAYLEKLRITRQQKNVAAISPNVDSLDGSSPLFSTGMAKK